MTLCHIKYEIYSKYGKRLYSHSRCRLASVRSMRRSIQAHNAKLLRCVKPHVRSRNRSDEVATKFPKMNLYVALDSFITTMVKTKTDKGHSSNAVRGKQSTHDIPLVTVQWKTSTSYGQGILHGFY
jgi:hypothetical protein